MHTLLVTAHSGCLGTPPNSLTFAEAALEAGADFLEFDLRLSVQGTLVLSHDPVTAEDNSLLGLEEVWRWVSDRGGGFNLDVKELAVLAPLAKFLQGRAGRSVPTVITGCPISWMSDARRLFPGIPVLLNLEAGPGPQETSADWSGRVVAEARSAGAAGLNANHELVTPALADRARRALVPLFAWTVNCVPDLRRMIALGVSGITTDYPNRSHRILTGF